MDVRVGVVVALCLALAAGGAAYVRASMFSPVIQYCADGRVSQNWSIPADFLFDADSPTFVFVMTERNGEQQKATIRHPLLSLFMYPPVRALLPA